MTNKYRKRVNKYSLLNTKLRICCTHKYAPGDCFTLALSQKVKLHNHIVFE